NGVSQNSTRTIVVNGVLGGSITLPLELPAGTKAIIWNYRGEASSFTSILFIQLNESKNPQVTKTDPKRGKRLNITQSYSLQVSNLTMTDTGSYTAQITTEDYARDLFTYTLRNGTCEIHLTCIVENTNHNVSVGWQASGITFLREPNLTVSWDPKNSSDQNYTCQAENAVSNLSVSVSAQTLCTDSSQNTDTPGSPGNTVYAQVTHPIQVRPFHSILHHYCYDYSQTYHHNHQHSRLEKATTGLTIPVSAMITPKGRFTLTCFPVFYNCLMF
ncbi:hypothetical protein A6R68_17140, partial [Neotoma lepida]